MKTVLGMLAVMVLLVGSAQGAAAASGRCTVVEVQADRLVIDCGEGNQDFPAGTMIKIKSERGKAVEGC